MNNKSKIKSDQINRGILKILRYSYPLTIIMIVTVLFILGNFLYNNVYQTLSYARIITDLKKQVSAEYPEVEKFNLIVKNINSKTTPRDEELSNLKNPFN